MLCQMCNKNEATTFVKQNINGKVTQMNLCSECAKKMNLGLFGSDSFFSDFKPFGIWNSPFNIIPSDDVKACPKCKSTYAQISQTGKVGCDECYQTFKDLLSHTISKIHGNTNHCGKIPKSAGGELKKQAEIKELKAKLDKAVAEQDYEQAVVLRDQIKNLEQNNG